MNRLIKWFKGLKDDEGGGIVMSEHLVLLVGVVAVASVVVGVLAVMMLGECRDGSGGVVKTITDNINKMIDDIMVGQ